MTRALLGPRARSGREGVTHSRRLTSKACSAHPLPSSVSRLSARRLAAHTGQACRARPQAPPCSPRCRRRRRRPARSQLGDQSLAAQRIREVETALLRQDRVRPEEGGAGDLRAGTHAPTKPTPEASCVLVTVGAVTAAAPLYAHVCRAIGPGRRRGRGGQARLAAAAHQPPQSGAAVQGKGMRSVPNFASASACRGAWLGSSSLLPVRCRRGDVWARRWRTSRLCCGATREMRRWPCRSAPTSATQRCALRARLEWRSSVQRDSGGALEAATHCVRCKGWGVHAQPPRGQGEPPPCPLGKSDARVRVHIAQAELAAVEKEQARMSGALRAADQQKGAFTSKKF